MVEAEVEAEVEVAVAWEDGDDCNNVKHSFNSHSI